MLYSGMFYKTFRLKKVGIENLIINVEIYDGIIGLFKCKVRYNDSLSAPAAGLKSVCVCMYFSTTFVLTYLYFSLISHWPRSLLADVKIGCFYLHLGSAPDSLV